LAAFAGEYRAAAPSSTFAVFLDGAPMVVRGHYLTSRFLYGPTSAGPSRAGSHRQLEGGRRNYARALLKEATHRSAEEAASPRDIIAAAIVIRPWRGALFL
jgi:hypothetical protein